MELYLPGDSFFSLQIHFIKDFRLSKYDWLPNKPHLSHAVFVRYNQKQPVLPKTSNKSAEIHVKETVLEFDVFLFKAKEKRLRFTVSVIPILSLTIL